VIARDGSTLAALAARASTTERDAASAVTGAIAGSSS
jgi:hypothetical protein